MAVHKDVRETLINITMQEKSMSTSELRVLLATDAVTTAVDALETVLIAQLAILRV